MRLRLLLLALVTFSTTLSAADITGTWRVSFLPDFGGNNDTKDCTFRQDGRQLSVKCWEGTPPVSGQVMDRHITFDVKTGRNNEFTVHFMGTMDAQGTTIKGSWHLVMNAQPKDGDWEATKQ
jgi:hypothetical protein